MLPRIVSVLALAAGVSNAQELGDQAAEDRDHEPDAETDQRCGRGAG
jgi:hypothetical protein